MTKRPYARRRPLPAITDADAQRFLSKVRVDEGGCWLWTGRVLSGGYGQFTLSHRGYQAHRVSFAIHYGADPGHLCVCHSCDVRACVNPEHLSLGTYLDNSTDMAAKGRVVRGERCTFAKLTRERVREIRRAFQQGATKASLARRFDISERTIFDVVVGRTWRVA